MGLLHSPLLNRDGLVLHLNAYAKRSYPGTGTTWYDLSGRNNHGTMVNGVSYLSSNGGVMSFDGVNDYVDLGRGFDVISNGFCTFHAVVRFRTVPTTGNGMFFLANVDPDGINYGMQFGFIPSLGLMFGAYAGGGAFPAVFSGVTPVANQWYFITGLRRPAGYELYVNGARIASSTDTQGGNVSQTSMTIGTRNRDFTQPQGRNWLDAQLDDIRIYNRALSPSEIRQIFNSTRKRFGV
jgi:hypothetical protein